MAITTHTGHVGVSAPSIDADVYRSDPHSVHVGFRTHSTRLSVNDARTFAQQILEMCDTTDAWREPTLDDVSCRHVNVHRGPDVPQPVGSLQSEVCYDCGSTRQKTHTGRALGDWQPKETT